MILNDAILPYHEKDRPTIEKCCNSLRDILNIKRIFLISKENPNIPNTNFIPEGNFTNIVDLNFIKDIWNNSGSQYAYRAGWIYQQLLKLSVDEIIKDLSMDFLVCDSDIIFLNNPYNKIKKNIFPYAKAYSGEYHEPYRLNYNRLMKEETTSGFSFINHHMILNKKYLKKLKKLIEEKNNKQWDLSIIECLDLNSFSDFSEYDLYGNWMFKYNKKNIVEIELKIKDINYIPSEQDILNFKNSGIDILSSQAWAR